jgi:hypothetical protein
VTLVERAKITCDPYHAVAIEIVSTQSLLETGIFRAWTGDFQEILAEVADFRGLENPKTTKSPQNAGFSRIN